VDTHCDPAGSEPRPDPEAVRRAVAIGGLSADTDARRDRLVALLDGHAGDGNRAGSRGLVARLGRICDLAVRELGVSGAGVTVMATLAGGLAGHRDQLYATGELARLLEDLQLTAGEGPCLDAFRGGVPVLVADLAAESTRWLGFGPEALGGGAAAVFSLPLQVGAVRLGTMDLHRAVPGGLTDDQLADAWNLAGLATEVLLELARDTGSGAGADGERGGASVDPGGLSGAGWLSDVHASVHQASGMVAAREHIGVGEALLRLRAHAFAHSRPITEVAQLVIDRKLVLPRQDDNHDDTGSADSDTETDR
jgi:hypothetical protein